MPRSFSSSFLFSCRRIMSGRSDIISSLTFSTFGGNRRARNPRSISIIAIIIYRWGIMRVIMAEMRADTVAFLVFMPLRSLRRSLSSVMISECCLSAISFLSRNCVSTVMSRLSNKCNLLLSSEFTKQAFLT